jgi:peptide deformylase
VPVRPILVYGDPRLVAENEPVERFGQELTDLVRDMCDTCWATPGLGLAAPQIGVNLQLAIVDVSIGQDPSELLVLANPEMLHQEGRANEEEGCLSFPGLSTTVIRPKSVRLRAQDLEGKWRELEANETKAQAFCHELDHLAGVLLIDHLRGLKRRMFLRRVEKLRSLRVWPENPPMPRG